MYLYHVLTLGVLLITGFVLPSTDIINGYCPQYFAHIDISKTTVPDCLSVTATTGCGGELEITNSCSDTAVIDGEEIPTGITTYVHRSVQWNSEPDSGIRQEWVLDGSAGGEFIRISGWTQDENERAVFSVHEILGEFSDPIITAIVSGVILITIVLLLAMLLSRRLTHHNR